MNFIKNLKIRYQLLILLFLLLFPLVYFVIVQVRDGLEEKQEYAEAIIQLNESEQISQFIHHLQKERARVMAANEGDSLFITEAISQRNLTDAAKKELLRFLEENKRSIAGISSIDDLTRYRYEFDEGQIEPLEFRNYSRALIFTFLDRIDENATGISDVSLSRDLQSFKSLVEAKVHLGRLRSLMMRIVLADGITYEEYAQFQSLKDSYQHAIDNFKLYASKVALEDIQKQLSTDSYKKVNALFQQLEHNPHTDLSNYNTLSLFTLLTKSVEDLRAAEDRMIFRIGQRVQEESVEQNQKLIVLGTLMLLSLVLAVLLSMYIINLISSSLFVLKNAADRIKMGATDVAIKVNSRNELGIVADSFRGVVQKNLALTRVAEAIGNGNYEVEVAVQSPEDKLSFAIQDMKEKLGAFTRESQKRTWILGGISDLNHLLYEETKTSQLSEKIIAFLCEYSGSEAGVFYMHDNGGKLNPLATYGVEQPLEQLSSFAIGAGQVGQAVSSEQIKVLESIPDEYLKIKSGLSDISPANIIIIPLQFSDTVVGAIELCTRQPYSELHKEFLKHAGERISIIFHTLQAHFKTQELLYETQNQAEELETQQEELRELNAELKASEEELKVSQEELQEKNAELEEKAQLLEEQYEALRSKNNALEDAREAIELKIKQVEEVSRYKSEFLANMSHELRTPLNSILILSRLLADNPEQNLSQKQGEHARIIHKSGSDLLKLINEILDLSKIESGMIRLETAALNVKEIDLESTFKELALNKKIEFNVALNTEGFDSLVTDRFRLEQILKNFLSNAIKFTPAGGKVDFTIGKVKNGKRFKSEQLNNSEEVMAFAVKDSGIGIPKEKQTAIFEAFQQADSSTTRKFGGTGLGLAISKELATLLGGEIGLESEEGHGSTFTLYLPKKLQQETNNTAESQQASAQPAPAAGLPAKLPAAKKANSLNATFDELSE